MDKLPGIGREMKEIILRIKKLKDLGVKQKVKEGF
jgi:hypothetical protein